jgi:hypothetical protein
VADEWGNLLTVRVIDKVELLSSDIYGANFKIVESHEETIDGQRVVPGDIRYIPAQPGTQDGIYDVVEVDGVPLTILKDDGPKDTDPPYVFPSPREEEMAKPLTPDEQREEYAKILKPGLVALAEGRGLKVTTKTTKPQLIEMLIADNIRNAKLMQQ